jgi:hypothetical protein
MSWGEVRVGGTKVGYLGWIFGLDIWVGYLGWIFGLDIWVGYLGWIFTVRRIEFTSIAQANLN